VGQSIEEKKSNHSTLVSQGGSSEPAHSMKQAGISAERREHAPVIRSSSQKAS